jgi:hypothetical protein
MPTLSEPTVLGELMTTTTAATPDLKTQLDNLAVEIKAEIKRTIRSVIRIGKMLLEAKAITADPKCGIEGDNPDARFGKWVSSKFEDTPKVKVTFWNFMNVARVYGDRDPAELDKLGLSVLYELTAPKTPASVREAVEEAVKRGETFTVKEIQAIIKKALPAPTKPTKPTKTPAPTRTTDPVGSEDDTPPWDDNNAATNPIGPMVHSTKKDQFRALTC